MGSELKSELKEWTVALLIGFIIFLLIRFFIFAPYRIDGDSMSATLENNDKVLIWKLFYNDNNVDRFDIVVFKANEKENYIKRVIGLPGETVEYKDDRLYIDGEYVPEPFLNDEHANMASGQQFTNDFTLEEVANVDVIPEGHVLVLGDNRLNSYDSRHYGLVPIDELMGEAKFRFWPLGEMTRNFN